MKNFLIKKLFVFFLIAVTVFSFTACAPKHDNAPTAKVILFIGDGMGENHILNSELNWGEKTYFTSFEHKTYVDTASLSGVTDSAAAATAMATGVRVKNDVLAIDISEPITSITEIAKANEYGAGVVTSDLITGATPAGFSAHAFSRNVSADILLSQRYSPLDLLIGSGNYDIYQTLFEEEGFTWVNEFSELKLRNKRYVATFDDVMPTDNSDDVPNLTQLTEYAIKYMEKHHPNGYFLMIEGAKIDKASHSNDLQFMMENLYDFSNAIKLADEMLKKTGDNYSLIVTADHETGKLDLATQKSELTNDLYNSKNHTLTPVPLYFKSTLSEVPQILQKEIILNTDIFFLCKYLLALN